MNDLNIAQEKAKFEIKKEIKKIKKLCSSFAGYGELLFYIYYLHITRTLKLTNQDNLTDMGINSFDDISKYLISCITKYGKKEFLKYTNNQLINIELTSLLTKTALHINSNYEAISLLSLMDNITVLGERNQHVKIDTSKLLKNKNFNFLKYGNRIQIHIHHKKKNLSNYNDHLNYFKEEFAPHNDLIKNEFGLDLDDIILILNFILEEITKQLENGLKNCPVLENGKIDVQSEATLIATIKSFIFDINISEQLFVQNIVKLLKKLTFNPSKFNIQELGYHMLLRQPIIKLNSSYIISPQLLLDSLFVNFHYTLLESKKTKHDYKKNSAGLFIDKIVNIGNKYNFTEADRELELYDGKRQLGDIDLVLYNKEFNQHILIEAKNHSLPLSVYFGDIIETKKHLEYLQSKWEDKVHRRFRFINKHLAEHNISKNFKYIIVSKYPEILSHYSDYLVLSINEYEYFLKNIQNNYNFETIYEDLYSNTNNDLEEMKKFAEEFTNFQFTQPTDI